MIKENLWCGYCRCQEFIEHHEPKHPADSRYSSWECTFCHASYENNPGYGYFTTHWGVEANKDADSRYALATGEPLDPNKLPRTPEGIVRHSGSEEELKAYLTRTQIQ